MCVCACVHWPRTGAIVSRCVGETARAVGGDRTKSGARRPADCAADGKSGAGAGARQRSIGPAALPAALGRPPQQLFSHRLNSRLNARPSKAHRQASHYAHTHVHTLYTRYYSLQKSELSASSLSLRNANTDTHARIRLFAYLPNTTEKNRMRRIAATSRST